MRRRPRGYNASVADITHLVNPDGFFDGEPYVMPDDIHDLTERIQERAAKMRDARGGAGNKQGKPAQTRGVRPAPPTKQKLPKGQTGTEKPKGKGKGSTTAAGAALYATNPGSGAALMGG